MRAVGGFVFLLLCALCVTAGGFAFGVGSSMRTFTLNPNLDSKFTTSSLTAGASSRSYPIILQAASQDVVDGSVDSDELVPRKRTLLSPLRPAIRATTGFSLTTLR